MSVYTLYGRKNSGSFAVQVALREIGEPFDIEWVTTDDKEVAEYRKVCPTGRVPALRLPDGTVMFESAAMLIHLAQNHARAGLAPAAGNAGHALFLQWMVYLSANVYEALLRIYYPDRYSARGEADVVPIRDQATADFLRHVNLLSRNLTPYLLGAEYSIADVYLYMLLTWYPPGKQALFSEFPTLAVHAQKVGTRSAVIAVEADHG